MRLAWIGNVEIVSEEEQENEDEEEEWFIGRKKLRMLLNVHEDPYNVYLTRLKLTHVEPRGGGGAVMVDGYCARIC